MIEKMWVVVTCSACSRVTHCLVCNGDYWQNNHFIEPCSNLYLKMYIGLYEKMSALLIGIGSALTPAVI